MRRAPRPAWASSAEASRLLADACRAFPALTPARVRLVVDAVDLASGPFRAATWCPAGPRAAMARALVADGYLAVVRAVTTGTTGLWVGPGPRAEEVAGPFRALPTFGGRKAEACPTCGATKGGAA